MPPLIIMIAQLTDHISARSLGGGRVTLLRRETLKILRIYDTTILVEYWGKKYVIDIADFDKLADYKED